MTEEECFHIVIKFSGIRKIGMGFDFGKACVYDILKFCMSIKQFDHSYRLRHDDPPDPGGKQFQQSS